LVTVSDGEDLIRAEGPRRDTAGWAAVEQAAVLLEKKSRTLAPGLGRKFR
jgi:hypothetical protein